MDRKLTFPRPVSSQVNKTSGHKTAKGLLKSSSGSLDTRASPRSVGWEGRLFFEVNSFHSSPIGLMLKLGPRGLN